MRLTPIPERFWSGARREGKKKRTVFLYKNIIKLLKKKTDRVKIALQDKNAEESRKETYVRTKGSTTN